MVQRPFSSLVLGNNLHLNLNPLLRTSTRTMLGVDELSELLYQIAMHLFRLRAVVYPASSAIDV